MEKNTQFLVGLPKKVTPQKSNIDTKNDAMFKGSRYRLSKAHHFGARYPPLVKTQECNEVLQSW